MTEHLLTTPVRSDRARVTIVDPSLGLRRLGLAELPDYLELLWTLAWRDVRVRYKQTAIGAAWAVVQPLLTMVVFTLVFSKVAHISSGGKPYAVVVFVGLLPWQLLSQAVARSTSSLVSNGTLISKIYFPRVIVPLSSMGAPAFDFLVALGILACLMAGYGVAPSRQIVALPAFILLTLAASLAIGLWLSLLNARFRDVGYAIPFILQLLMYVSPVAYPLSAVPAKWRTYYELNPISDIIQGFRWSLIGDSPPNWAVLAGSSLVLIGVLVWGLSYFARAQQTVADVI